MPYTVLYAYYEYYKAKLKNKKKVNRNNIILLFLNVYLNHKHST